MRYHNKEKIYLNNAHSLFAVMPEGEQNTKNLVVSEQK